MAWAQFCLLLTDQRTRCTIVNATFELHTDPAKPTCLVDLGSCRSSIFMLHASVCIVTHVVNRPPLPNACVCFSPVYLPCGSGSARSACRDCSGCTSRDKTLFLPSNMCVWSLFSGNKIAWPCNNFIAELSSRLMLLCTPWKSGSRLARGEQLVEQSEVAAL